MSTEWLRLPIYVDDQLRLPANNDGPLEVKDAYERINLVFNEIEQTRAEGRLMNVEIFDGIDSLFDRVRDKDLPEFSEIRDLVVTVGSYYGLDPKCSERSHFPQQTPAGDFEIRIDKHNMMEKSERVLEDIIRKRDKPWWRFWQ